MRMNLVSTPDFGATVENKDDSNVLCTTGIAAQHCDNSVTKTISHFHTQSTNRVKQIT